MIEVKDTNQNIVNIPEKTYQDSQKTTDQIGVLSERAAKAENEVKTLKEKIEKDKRKITVTLKESSADTTGFMGMLYGLTSFKGKGQIASIAIDNVDEADKFLTNVLESEIAQEKDELQKKFEGVETKLDEKDREITLKARDLKRVKDIHSDRITDMENSFERELTKIRKTAKGKVEKQLIHKDVEFAELENKIELERQTANLREIELLGKLEHFKEGNEALEAKITELENAKPTLLGKTGNYINKLMGYKKALKALERFTRRGHDGGFNGSKGLVYNSCWNPFA